MGNSCSCADNVEPSTEMRIEQDEIRKRLQDDGSSIDQESLNLLIKNMHHIVRLQAFFRGRRVRDKIQK